MNLDWLLRHVVFPLVICVALPLLAYEIRELFRDVFDSPASEWDEPEGGQR